MYYIFKNNYCIGVYPYLPQLEKDEQAIQTETDYSNLSELQLKDGVIAIVKPPPKPPQIIETESYSPETVELYQAIAGLYELVEKGERQ